MWKETSELLSVGFEFCFGVTTGQQEMPMNSQGGNPKELEQSSHIIP